MANVRKRQVKSKTGNQSTSQKGKKEKESTLWEGLPARKTLAGAAVFLVILGIALVFLYPRTDKLSTSKEKEDPEKIIRNVQTKNTKKDPPPPQKKDIIPPNLINKEDAKIIKDLESADKGHRGPAQQALQTFNLLLNKYPNSPYARFGKAKALEKLAEELRSNEVLQQSIDAYDEATKAPDCPSELLKQALLKMTDRLDFLGKSRGALNVMLRLSNLFPEDNAILNKLGVQHLLVGSIDGAGGIFRKVLQNDPNDGFSKSHLGFVLKTQLKYRESIPFLEEGIKSGKEGADHSRFYFHLGDAYSRLGNRKEAWRVYEEAAKKGHFLSAWQRSLYNADTPLKAQPWWTPEESGYLKNLRKLEANWKTIRDEALAVMDLKSGGFLEEDENLREKGDWLQYTLYQQGRKNVANCRKTPKTCALIDSMPDASGCKRGQVKFSVMHPGTHIWPHCGPTNCRLRAHLGLVIPKDVWIRCGEEQKTWKEGKVIIIDDSIDHEVWHNGTSFRLIFIVDFWHPELTPKQKAYLTPI